MKLKLKPNELQTRHWESLELRATPEKGERTVTGIGVPYGQEIQLWPGEFEEFERGAVDAGGAILFYGHREPIGVITATRETESGFEIEGRISKTPRGDEVYTLLKDGALHAFSIGFEPLGDSYRIEQRENPNREVCIWQNVRAREFSIVPFPAYEDAQVTSVRNQPTDRKETPQMDTLTRSDLEPINDALTNMERRMETLAVASTANTAPAVEYRSMGELLKAISREDPAALAFYERAFAGTTTADVILKDTFIGEFIKFAAERRRITNTFTQGALPADGMSVDYFQLESSSFKVGKQTAEGADLPGVSAIKLKDATAPVETIGGWSEISLQTIKRSSIAAMDTLLTGMSLEYARNTEAGVKNVYQGIITANAAKAETSVVLGAQPASATAKQWIEALVELAELYDLSAFTMAGIHVSKDVFKALANLTDGGNRLMNVAPDRNTIGRISIPGMSGDMAGINVQLLSGAPANTAAAYDPVAIKTLETPGSPAMLQDSNVINLTNQFSIYGFHAVITPFPEAIVPLIATAPAAG